jgi:hypothetical protein
MSRRDYHFSSCHRSAQAVTAILLGCRVDHVNTDAETAIPLWGMETAAFSDVLTICASGYEMERLLGRLHEAAWDRSHADRTLISNLYLERTGVAMEPAELDEQFMVGAASSRAIIEHGAARSAIDLLAEALSEAEMAGKDRLTSNEVLAVTGLGSQGQPNNERAS